MNKKLKRILETKIYVAECLLQGKQFHVNDSERNFLPVECMTRNEAKKKGLVLKRGAKPVGGWSFTLAHTAGSAHGVLYLSTSFKSKV